MGRYLACGIVSSISIRQDTKGWHRDNDFDFFAEKENIIKELGKTINIKDYKCIESENSLTFKINKKLFNENIHSFINEYREKVDYGCMKVYGYFSEDYHDFIVTKEEHLIELCEYGKGSRGEGTAYLKCGTEESFDEELAYYPDQCYLFRDNKRLRNNLDAVVYYIKFWFSISKIDCEDETALKYLLDYFSRGKFENPLSKDLLFYIAG